MKKFVSILLALVMVLSLVPVALAEELADTTETAETVETAEPAPVETETKSETSAPAALGGAGETTNVAKVDGTEYATLAAAVEAAKDGQTITLLKDVELSATLEISANKTVALDLNGKKLTTTTKSGDNSRHYYAIDNYGTFTLLDSSAEQTGEIRARGIENLENGKMIIEGGTIVAIDTNGGAAVWNKDDLTINGGVFKAEHEGASNDQYGPGCVYSEGTVSVTGGTFESANKRTYAFVTKTGTVTITPAGGKTVNISGAHGGLGVDGGKAIINGGNYSSSEYYGLYVSNDSRTANVTVNGGNFTGKTCSALIGSDVKNPVDSTLTINGGTFNKPINEQENAAGKLKVTGGAFTDLANAVKYATNGATIKLAGDVTANVTIPAGKTVTLDLNGHTLNGGKNNDKAALLNEGTVTIKDSSAGKTGTIKREDDADKTGTTYYVIKNNGTMTIEQANVINNSGYKKTNPAGSMAGSSLICNGDRVDDTETTLTINDGVFEQQNFLAIKNGTFGILNVNGGKFTSKHSAIQNWYKADIKGGEINGQLWTDAYTWDKDGYSAGVTKISGATKFTGEIVMDITLYTGITKGKIPTLEISGGEMNITKWSITEGAAGAGAKPVITGGTFSVNPIDYVQKGYAVTKEAADKFTVAAVKDTAAVEVTNNSDAGKTSVTIDTITPDNASGGDTNTIDISSLDTGKPTNEIKVNESQLNQIMNPTATKPVEFKLSSKLSVAFSAAAAQNIASQSGFTGEIILTVTPNATVTGTELTAKNSVANAKSQVVTVTLTGGASGATPAELYAAATAKGKVTITVPFDMTGYNRLNVYYLDPTTGKAVHVGRATYDTNAGTATFDVEHFSSYVLVPGKSSSGGGGSGSGSVGSGTHTVTSDLTGTITKVTVDGKTVASKHYTVSGGNVTFTEAFMKTLSNGTHKVTIETATKIARGTFTVDNGTKPVVSSKTGDAGIALYAGLAIASVMGGGLVLTSRKRKNH